MVSIQELFLIKSGLQWRVYGIQLLQPRYQSELSNRIQSLKDLEKLFKLQIQIAVKMDTAYQNPQVAGVAVLVASLFSSQYHHGFYSHLVIGRRAAPARQLTLLGLPLWQYGCGENMGLKFALYNQEQVIMAHAQ